MMLLKILGFTSLGLTLTLLWMALGQRSAFVLRQENQDQHWPGSSVYFGGRYQRSTEQWQHQGGRSSGSGFRGGGPGAGK
jgi:uncharacterized membrane protein YgcG